MIQGWDELFGELVKGAREIGPAYVATKTARGTKSKKSSTSSRVAKTATAKRKATKTKRTKATTSKKTTRKTGATRGSKASTPSFKESLSALSDVRGLKESFIIVLFAVSTFLFLILASHELSDPGWRRVSSEAFIANGGGVVGAWLADVLLTLFGMLAWAFPLIALIGALRLLWPKLDADGAESVLSVWVGIVRAIGTVCVVLGGAGLASLHVGDMHHVLPSSAGGIVGAEFSQWVESGFSVAGATIVLSSLLLIGLSILDIAWIGSLTGVMAKAKEAGLVSLAWSLDRSVGVVHAVGNRLADVFDRIRGWRFQGVRLPSLSSGRPAGRVEPSFGDERAKAQGKPSSKSVASRTQKTAPVAKPAKAKKAKRPTKRLVRQGSLFDGDGDVPSMSLLDPSVSDGGKGYTAAQLSSMSQLLEMKLKDFKINATVEAVLPGPVITRFEIQLAPGIKVSRISNLAKDLARSLAVLSVRVVEVIPGKTTVGIEIPNAHREIIKLSEVLTSNVFDDSDSHLTLALGKDIAGQPVVANLAKMPHLLVAGTTGSGKSVGLNAMLMSMLYKATPKDVRLIMIDPKMLELSVYDDIPHLLTPVVTDMKEAANALRWCVAEMERRYKLMANLGVRNLAGYNRKVKEAIAKGEPLPDPIFPEDAEIEHIPTLEPLPKIVVVIDEFADMMMIVGKKVEELIARIAQKARAAGIHLILATQRPSVDVITGLIKANVPARVSFQVSSKIDSRTVLDQGGAEQLLGHGDMLYLAPGSGMPERVHGAFVDDDEVHRVCDDWRARGQPDYLEEVLTGEHETAGPVAGMPGEKDKSDESDPIYDEAVQFVLETRRASISGVQRKFRIGYNRSARLIEAMEAAGLVSSVQSNGGREVIAPSH